MQKSVAKRYAKALFEIAHSEENTSKLDVYLQNLEDLHRALQESKELQTILVNPAVKLDSRHKIVRTIGERAGWDRLFCNFVCLLVDRSRLKYVGDIKMAFRERVDESKGLVRIHITAARPLSDTEVGELLHSFRDKTNTSIEVETSVDPKLIGGVVARVGETIYDASIRTQLQKVRRSILKTV